MTPGGTAADRPEAGDGLVLAAGAVLWREVDGATEVALVHRPKYDDWSLPKGKVDPGEHLLETAVREVAEETGHAARLGAPLGTTSYEALGRPKRVHWWAAETREGRFVPHAEIDGLRWASVGEAAGAVDADSDREVLARFAALPPRSGLVVVLRHAKALARKAWDGDDEDRPLHRDGEAQAAALPGLVEAYGPDAVITSPSRRCLDTVAPLVARAGLLAGAETVGTLSEHGYQAQPDSAAVLVDSLVGDGRRAVVCSHRPVLPGLLAVLRARAVDDAVAAALDLDREPLRPGELVAAHTAGGHVVAAERHRP